MSSLGPEVLFGSNQRPERVSIPALYFLQKGHTSDFGPTTLSSWLKQTILLCYITNKQTNSPWTWSKLKRMALGPLWPLRPFMVGLWWTKSCKLVTVKLKTHFQIFYLKDLTWSDDNNMYLGPVVAAQQVLDSSPQTSYPRKEKGGTSAAVLRSLNPWV